MKKQSGFVTDDVGKRFVSRSAAWSVRNIPRCRCFNLSSCSGKLGNKSEKTAYVNCYRNNYEKIIKVGGEKINRWKQEVAVNHQRVWLVDWFDWLFSFLKQKQLQKLNIRPPPPPAGQSSPVQVSLSPFLRPSGEGEAPVSNLHVSTFIHLLLNRFLIITIIIYIYLYIYIHIYVYVLHWFALSFQCQSPGPADSAPPTGGCALNCRLTEKTGF